MSVCWCPRRQHLSSGDRSGPWASGLVNVLSIKDCSLEDSICGLGCAPEKIIFPKALKDAGENQNAP